MIKLIENNSLSPLGVESLCINPANFFLLRTVETSKPNADIARSLIAKSGKSYTVFPIPARNNKRPKINEKSPNKREI